jgi:hypothetical protein
MLKEHITKLLSNVSIHSEMEVLNNKNAWIMQKRSNGNLLNSAVHQHLLAGRKLIKELVKVKHIAMNMRDKALSICKCASRKCMSSIMRIIKDVVRKKLINRTKSRIANVRTVTHLEN